MRTFLVGRPKTCPGSKGGGLAAACSPGDGGADAVLTIFRRANEAARHDSRREYRTVREGSGMSTRQESGLEGCGIASCLEGRSLKQHKHQVGAAGGLASETTAAEQRSGPHALEGQRFRDRDRRSWHESNLF